MIAASYSLSLNNKEENQGSMFIVSIFIKKRYFLIKVEICSDLILNECSFNICTFQVLKQVFFFMHPTVTFECFSPKEGWQVFVFKIRRGLFSILSKVFLS